jgi:hypothetical protein
VVLTTGADLGDLNPAEFASVLRKPVDPDVLVEVVEVCLHQPRRAPFGHA